MGRARRRGAGIGGLNSGPGARAATVPDSQVADDTIRAVSQEGASRSGPASGDPLPGRRLSRRQRRRLREGPAPAVPGPDGAEGPPPPVLHEDELVLALDKPAGMLSVPGIGPEKADCLAARVQTRRPDARIVHRLDRDTSGVIVMGIGPDAQRFLSIEFQERRTRKRYLAVVAGHVAEDEGEVDLPMRKDLEDTPRQVIDHAQGRPALTRYRVLERTTHEGPDGRPHDATRVELVPVTGRSHQLRLHLRELGHPILGDELYATSEQHAAAGRLLLHAAALEIAHPASGAPLALASPCPF